MDALCGAYCLLNAVHYLCGPLSSERADDLFWEILRELHQSGETLKRMRDGTGLYELARVLRDIIQPRFPIQRQRPFCRHSKMKSSAFWAALSRFFEERGGVALMGIGGHHDHWTLVTQATPKMLRLFDSDGMQRLYRCHCRTVGEKTKATHILYPSHTYFLWVPPEVGR